jgi:antitoxin (DNA-binding transcriptional repressor) of toxin-antitoxin stability system
MVRQLNMPQAKTALSELVTAALRGDQVVIVGATKSVVKLRCW